jgi:drug/metabolite transporter (DMT)-like permease
MTGALWALTAGLGFGVFQSVNRRAVRDMGVYLATFIQLLVSAIVLGLISAATQDLSVLSRAPLAAYVNFGLAGLFHFFIGWTLLNASQKRIGAARTSSLIATTPLFGAVLAAVTLSELPGLGTLASIVLIVGGVYLVNNLKSLNIKPGASQEGLETGWRAMVSGVLAALCWSISPIFIRQGLKGLPSPLLGVTIGISASALGYGVSLILLGNGLTQSASVESILWKAVAGVLVGLSTWMRWIALDLTAVAVVLAISLVSVPVVNLLSPLFVGRHLERVTSRVWLGSSLVIGGSLFLILAR